MKIVIAVESDKQTVEKRTGQAAFFAIYEDAKVIEFIQNSHGHGRHSKGEHQEGGKY